MFETYRGIKFEFRDKDGTVMVFQNGTHMQTWPTLATAKKAAKKRAKKLAPWWRII